jgi:hypothetical protein
MQKGKEKGERERKIKRKRNCRWGGGVVSLLPPPRTSFLLCPSSFSSLKYKQPSDFSSHPVFWRNSSWTFPSTSSIGLNLSASARDRPQPLDSIITNHQTNPNRTFEPQLPVSLELPAFVPLSFLSCPWFWSIFSGIEVQVTTSSSKLNLISYPSLSVSFACPWDIRADDLLICHHCSLYGMPYWNTPFKTSCHPRCQNRTLSSCYPNQVVILLVKSEHF